MAKMSLGQFCRFEVHFELGSQNLYTWILGCGFWAFALCNQLNQRDQVGLTRAHSLLLISQSIYQFAQCIFGVVSQKTSITSFRSNSSLSFSLTCSLHFFISSTSLFSFSILIVLPVVMAMEGKTTNQSKDPIQAMTNLSFG